MIDTRFCKLGEYQCIEFECECKDTMKYRRRCKVARGESVFPFNSFIMWVVAPLMFWSIIAWML